MSGLEIFGAVGAAAQFIVYGVKVLDFLSKVREAPDTIRKQIIQITQLLEVSRLIKQNPFLNSGASSSTLQKILQACEQETKSLSAVLVDRFPSSQPPIKATWKSLVAATKEKEVLAAFAKLEQLKSSLILCINTIDSSLLSSINIEVAQVRSEATRTNTAIKGLSEDTKEINARLNKVSPAIIDTASGVTTVLEEVHNLQGATTEIKDLISPLSNKIGMIEDLVAVGEERSEETYIKITTVHEELPKVTTQVASMNDQLDVILEHLKLNEEASSRTNPSLPAFQRLWTLPFAKNTEFVGRQSILENIHSKLDKEGHSRVALIGLGGVGKSQIAIEYAYRYHREPSTTSVFWIHASTTARFEQDFLAIGKQANLPGMNESNQNAKDTVKSWLNSEESGMWLIIVDNADDPEVLVQKSTAATGTGSTRLLDYLPQNSRGSILFTTRTRKAGIKFVTTRNIIDLAGMDFKEAHELLNTRLAEHENDEEETRELLETLEYLPLAITQAAAYIAENSISLAEYLEMYGESEDAKIELLSHDFEELGRDSESKNPIAATWLISFEHIKRADTFAADLLSYMACLDRIGIPKALLPTPPSAIQLTNALGLLQGYSLIRKTQHDLFDIHRLVYVSTRNWLRQNQTLTHWAGQCVSVVSDAYPEGWDHENRHTCELFLPHAQVILGYEEMFTKGSITNETSVWLTEISKVHSSIDNTRANVPIQKPITSLDIEENYFENFEPDLPAESVDTYDLMASLAHQVSGYLESQKGLYSAAERLICQAIRLQEAALGIWHADTLESVDALGFFSGHLSKHEVSELIYRKVVKAREEILGTEDRDTLSSINGLASVLHNRGKYQEAEPLFRRALAGREKVLGLDNINTLISMNDLALLLKDQGGYQEAERLYRQILAIYEERLGPEHPETLTSLNNLALIYEKQGDYEKAEKMHRRGLGGREKILAPDHPDILQSMNNLALIFEKQGKYDEAEEMHKRGLAGRERVLGPDHPDTLQSINNLAIVFEGQGKYEVVEAMHRRALAGKEKVLGPEHPETLQSLSNLAVALENQGKREEAMELYLQTLQSREKILGMEHPDTLMSVWNLALLLEDLKENEKALNLFKRAWEGAEKVLGSGHPETVKYRDEYECMMEDMGIKDRSGEDSSSSWETCSTDQGENSSDEGEQEPVVDASRILGAPDVGEINGDDDDDKNSLQQYGNKIEEEDKQP